MLNRSKLAITLTLASFLLSCSAKVVKTNNELYDDKSAELIERSLLVKEDRFDKKLNEKIDVSFAISMENSKTLSQVLTELGENDGNVYFFKGLDDPILPESSYEVKNFRDLVAYVKMTTNNRIYISENKYKKGLKIVRYQDRGAMKANFNEIKFNIKEAVPLKDLISDISEVTNFNIVMDQDVLGQSQLFNYYGNNIRDLIEYIQVKLDLFVDIDYHSKIIKFQKYETRSFDIRVQNLKLSGSSSSSSSAGDESGGGGSDGGISNSINLSLYEELDANIKIIMEKDNNIGSYYTFNHSIGKITVKGGYSTLKTVGVLIEQYNKSFETLIEFNLEIYEVQLNRENQYGIDFNLIGRDTTGDVLGSFRSSNQPALDSTTNRGLGITILGDSVQSDFVSNFLNTFGEVANYSAYRIKARNNIPYNSQQLDSENYIKNLILTNATTSTGQTSGGPSVTTETDKIQKGFTLTLLPKVINNSISVNVTPSVLDGSKGTTIKVNDNEISLPTFFTNSFSSNIIMKSGDRIVIGSSIKSIKTENYSGLFPEKFILGGTNDDKYIKRETVFVLTANIVK
jgi:hypothetical protein